MSDFGSLLTPLLTPLLWAAAQVTAVTAAAALACFAAKRVDPRAGGRVALLGLCLAAGLSLCALSPWPRWDAPAAAGVEAIPVSSHAKPRAEAVAGERSESGGGASLAAARAFAAALLDPPAGLPPVPEAEAPRGLGFGRVWGGWLAAGLILAGLLRFAAGWAQVARLRGRSRAVRDEDVLAEFAALKPAAGVNGPVELRETNALTTAAALGWRRPCVLLPAGWRAWTPADRTAVLAHELAHVAAGDFARTLLAQSCLLVQFYHPLSHVLAGRVKTAREVAADARAAALCGGRGPYLKSLAAVALTADPGEPTRRRQASPAGWPAAAFLPSRRSLHERVEMLRNPPVPRSRLATCAGPLAVAGVLGAAVLASGFRAAPAAQPPAARDAPPVRTDAKPRAAAAPGEANEAVPDLLAYVPADADLVAVIEAKALLEDPALAPVVAAMNADDVPAAGLKQYFGPEFAEIERVAFYVRPFAPTPAGTGLPVWVIRTVGPAPDPPPGAADEGVLIMKADARTLIYSVFGATEAVTAPAAAPFPASRLSPTRRPAGEPAGASLFLDVAAVRPVLLPVLNDPPDDPAAVMMLGLFRPLVTNTDAAAGSLTLNADGSLELAVTADSPTEQAAASVAATTRAAVTLLGNFLDTIPPPTGGDPAERAVVAAGLGAARDAVNSTTVVAAGTRTTLTVTADTSAPLLASLLVPAIRQARAAARRSQSQNNLKYLALALHNYHAANKSFPPRVVVENGVERSWRVELLPYLDQADLYAEYRKDQPWDSEANQKVLAKMPEVFRNPADDRGEPYTSYFAVTAANPGSGMNRGPTAWSPDPGEAVGLRELRDGTTTTVLVVEARKPVPWTKPEDLSYDAALPAMEPDWRVPLNLGGFRPGEFLAAFGDGSVYPFVERTNGGLLRSLFTRQGGEIVEFVDEDPLVPPWAAEAEEVREAADPG